MRSRDAIGLLIVYLVVYTIVLTFPGVLPFNRVEPRILGMPFVLVWYAVWVGLGALVLHRVERAITRDEDTARDDIPRSGSR